MPLTIIPASHEPKAHPQITSAGSLDEFLQLSCADSYIMNETHIVASSFEHDFNQDNTLYPSSSGFVRSAIEAWGRHSHLVIRPEDFWFTILVQMNFYMEKNAESVRHLFVAHADKQELHVEGNSWYDVVDLFRDKLQDSIKAPWLSEWISPGFSTTTDTDEMTATVLMMGLMKAYFDYSGGIICGIPSITLLGTKGDWQHLVGKVDRLSDFGREATEYADRLRPILTRIVNTFDTPNHAETRAFWDQMVQAKVKHSILCGIPPEQYIVSGWILGLFYWDSTGDPNPRYAAASPYHKISYLTYDDVRYGESPLENLPIGYAKAAFKMVNEHGSLSTNSDGSFDGWILAGNLGKRIVSGAPAGYEVALAAQGQSKNSEAEESVPATKELDDEQESGCFSGLLQPLNRFCKRKSKVTGNTSSSEKRIAQNEEKQSEKEVAHSLVEGVVPSAGHSTIQPMSGWFLFGPDKDPGPFYDDTEICGPTVDAIADSNGVEHYGDLQNLPNYLHHRKRLASN